MPIAPAERLGVALLLLAVAATAGAADLGTLFHSPAERARLDKLRRGDPAEVVVPEAARTEVTGFVRRSDGRHTVWINGVPVPVASGRADALLDPRAVRPGEGAVKIERAKDAEVKR